MPATPLHMGPAMVVKAVAGPYFSLTVYGFTQVVIDLETVVRILREDATLHGPSHTYLGATAIAAVCTLVGRPACQWLVDRWRDDPASPFMNWLRGPPKITWTAAVAGAFVAAWSHVALDSLMHGDMEPLAPFSDANALLHWISIEALHIFCIATGALGAAMMIGHYWLRRSGAIR